MVMVVVAAGAFPTRFCLPTVCSRASPDHNPTFSLSYFRRYTTRGNKRLSTRTTTRTTNKHKHKHCVACSNGVESAAETEAVEIEIEKSGNNTRRIAARVGIEASLQAVWDVLTDYEGLADFIPGLAQSRLLLQSSNYARLFQVGEQNLGLGLKFNAKGVIDCFEKELRASPSGGLARDIEFDMVQGDFEVFQGKWSILEESTTTTTTTTTLSVLSYSVRVKPKLWLPVGLVEGILCKEIKINLASIRRRALLII